MWRRLCLLVAVVVLAQSALAAAVGGDILSVRTIETSSYPEMAIEVGLPPNGTSATPRFEVRENGERIGRVDVERLARTRPFEVVLVIDASGSMKGKPMRDAQHAARTFIEQLPESASVAIVAIGSTPKVVSDFTTNRDKLSGAISDLEATGETAVYDALARAVALKSPLAGKQAERTVLLLSDGGDTTSNRSLGEASKDIRKAKVPVLTAAITSPEFNGHALEVLSKQSGGRLVAVKDSGQLAAHFQGLATEISTGYRLKLRSMRPSTKNLEYDIVAVSGSTKDSATLVVDNPLFAERAVSAVKWEKSRPNTAALVASLFLLFSGVFVLVTGLLASRSGTKSSMRLVNQYGTGLDAADFGDPNAVTARIVDAVEVAAGKRGFISSIGSKLERAGIALRPAEWITFHAISVIIGGFIAEFMSHNTLISAAVVCGLSALPLVYLEHKATKRTNLFNEQLPDTLNILSGGMRTGWGLQQSVCLVIEEGLEPTAGEFRRVETETRLGVALEDSLLGMAERLDSEPFRWITTAITIQREVGGNLAEVLDTVATSLREREALRRHVSALTAEGKFSAIILTILPFAVGGFMLILNPSYIMTALTNPVGWAIFGLAALMLVVGVVWLVGVTRIEY